MGENRELEVVCGNILSVLANALAGAAPRDKGIIDLSSAKKKFSNRVNIKRSFLQRPSKQKLSKKIQTN